MKNLKKLIPIFEKHSVSNMPLLLELTQLLDNKDKLVENSNSSADTEVRISTTHSGLTIRKGKDLEQVESLDFSEIYQLLEILTGDVESEVNFFDTLKLLVKKYIEKYGNAVKFSEKSGIPSSSLSHWKSRPMKLRSSRVRTLKRLRAFQNSLLVEKV